MSTGGIEKMEEIQLEVNELIRFDFTKDDIKEFYRQ